MSWQQQPYNPSYGQQQQQWGSQYQQPPPGAGAPPSYSASPPSYSAPPRGSAPPPQTSWRQTTPTYSSGGLPGGPRYQNYGSPTSSYSGPPTSSYGGPPTSSYGGPPPTSSYGGLSSSSYGSSGAVGYGTTGVGGYGGTGGSDYGTPASGAFGGALPQDQELLSWFKAVDKDNSGKISAVELREALVNNNWSHFNAETCRLLIGMFDTNGDGTIDFNEFAALWKYVKDWKSCFNSFDKDRSGNIDAGELQQALVSFGYRLSMDFCNLCTRVFDRNDKRTMKFDDFIQCCVMLRSLTESFKKLDTNRSGVININYEQFLEMAIDNSIR